MSRVAVVFAMLLTASIACANDGQIRGDAAFIEVLDAPALSIPRHKLASQAYNDALEIGGRLVGVGVRGLVAYSDDGGGTWSQGQVPVQSDLTAIASGAGALWVSGHDQVILRSDDQGATWRRVLDNRLSASQAVRHYEERIAAGEERLKPYLQQIIANTRDGWSLPFLDLAFDELGRGFAVGSFGMLYATGDAGESWVPALEWIDNPDFLSLNAIALIDGRFVIAGESGMVYLQESRSGRFVAHATGYGGSLFGVVGVDGRLLAFGLRGNAFLSEDGGERWVGLETGLTGLASSAVVEPGSGGVFLFASDGQVARSADRGRSFSRIQQFSGLPVVSSYLLSSGEILIASRRGMHVMSERRSVAQARFVK